MIERKKTSRTQRIVVILLGVFILVPGAIGFGDKLLQFFHVLYSDDGGGRFAIVPILTYLLVSLGFVFILVWGSFKGMLSDIEGPKYQMLEREEELERAEKGVAR